MELAGTGLHLRELNHARRVRSFLGDNRRHSQWRRRGNGDGRFWLGGDIDDGRRFGLNGRLGNARSLLGRHRRFLALGSNRAIDGIGGRAFRFSRGNGFWCERCGTGLRRGRATRGSGVRGLHRLGLERVRDAPRRDQADQGGCNDDRPRFLLGTARRTEPGSGPGPDRGDRTLVVFDLDQAPQRRGLGRRWLRLLRLRRSAAAPAAAGPLRRPVESHGSIRTPSPCPA